MVKKKTMLEQEFEDCKKGKKGVMPYYGEKKITFVWHNGKGYGRSAELTLTEEGIEEAEKLIEGIRKLNKKKGG